MALDHLVVIASMLDEYICILRCENNVPSSLANDTNLKFCFLTVGNEWQWEPWRGDSCKNLDNSFSLFLALIQWWWWMEITASGSLPREQFRQAKSSFLITGECNLIPVFKVSKILLGMISHMYIFIKTVMYLFTSFISFPGIAKQMPSNMLALKEKRMTSDWNYWPSVFPASITASYSCCFLCWYIY